MKRHTHAEFSLWDSILTLLATQCTRIYNICNNEHCRIKPRLGVSTLCLALTSLTASVHDNILCNNYSNVTLNGR